MNRVGKYEPIFPPIKNQNGDRTMIIRPTHILRQYFVDLVMMNNQKTLLIDFRSMSGID